MYSGVGTAVGSGVAVGSGTLVAAGVGAAAVVLLGRRTGALPGARIVTTGAFAAASVQSSADVLPFEQSGRVMFGRCGAVTCSIVGSAITIAAPATDHRSRHHSSQRRRRELRKVAPAKFFLLHFVAPYARDFH